MSPGRNLGLLRATLLFVGGIAFCWAISVGVALTVLLAVGTVVVRRWRGDPLLAGITAD